MLSIPPATRMSALPAASMSCANIIARIPEPHIFDSVTAPVDCGRPGAQHGLARGCLTLACDQAAPHQRLVDRIARHAGALDRGANRDSAQLPRLQCGEIPEQAADRRARGRCNDDRIVHDVLPCVCTNFDPKRRRKRRSTG